MFWFENWHTLQEDRFLPIFLKKANIILLSQMLYESLLVNFKQPNR